MMSGSSNFFFAEDMLFPLPKIFFHSNIKPAEKKIKSGSVFCVAEKIFCLPLNAADFFCAL